VGQYSIKDVEQLTGVKAHTIRIWEQRYHIIAPHRTDTNIRYYDDEQLKYLINVALLARHGRKISRIFRMTTEEMVTELKSLSGTSTGKKEYFDVQVNALVLAMLELDEEAFLNIIRDIETRHGFENIVIGAFVPFLSRVGVMWATHEINVVQEHFVSNLVRQKIISAIDSVSVRHAHPRKFLLFLPEGELHEIGLLFAHYLIKSRGHQVIYLGQTSPVVDLMALKKYYEPEYLLTYFTTGYGVEKMQEYVYNLTDAYQDKTLVVCGPQTFGVEFKNFQKVKKMKEVGDLAQFLDQL